MSAYLQLLKVNHFVLQHTRLLLLLLVSQAPKGVRSAKRRHQSPEWTILSHSYRLIQGEIVRPQVLRIVFIHVVRGRSGGLLQFSEGEALMILLASVSSEVSEILLLNILTTTECNAQISIRPLRQ